MFVLYAETIYSKFEQKFKNFSEMYEKIQVLKQLGYTNFTYNFEI